MQQGGTINPEPPNDKLSYGQALLKNRLKGVSTFKWHGKKFRTTEDNKEAERMPK